MTDNQLINIRLDIGSFLSSIDIDMERKRLVMVYADNLLLDGISVFELKKKMVVMGEKFPEIRPFLAKYIFN